MIKKSARDPEERLPLKLEPVSNGEFVPQPLPRTVQVAQRLAFERADAFARKRGISRREFLQTSAGMATALLALNELTACAGNRYALPAGSELDEAAARSALSGKELIFDVQTHHVATDRPWYHGNQAMNFLARTPQGRCGAEHFSDCYSRERFLQLVFLDSDTDLGVLSALPGDGRANPLHAREMAETREMADRLRGSPRLRIHGIVLPNTASSERVREDMMELREQWNAAAFKLYPLWGPNGEGYALDQEVGLSTIESALAVGLPLIAVHKGLPLPGTDLAHTWARDVGPAAKAFPKATFMIYHSGYDPTRPEGPYDPNARRGVDALIGSLQEHGIGKDGNVYAELGSTWRDVMKSPDQAAHLIGKLLEHVGEDRILWGTDAIWYGSPQDQIEAFRTFEIGERFQEQYGYPALTQQRKAKILGLNAARAYGLSTAQVEDAIDNDDLAKAKGEYREQRSPSFETLGPRTRRELLSVIRARGGLPG